MRYLTLKEESDKSWEEFEKNKTEEYAVGKKRTVPMQEIISVPDFCPTSSCNIFQHKDMAKIMINIRVPFEINYWWLKGREKCCQVTLNKHLIEVFASGYGTGEHITFSKGFPEELKFRICREMAVKCAYDNINYITAQKMDATKEEAIKDMISSEARCYGDLKMIADIHTFISQKEFFDNYNKRIRDDAKRFKKEWANPIKTKLYRKYENNTKGKRDLPR